MATTEKKPMKAELAVTVFDEMKKATSDWVKGFPVVAKEASPIKKQWKVDVDPRKYSPAELKRILFVNIAYDLKTFDVHCAKLKQSHEKGKLTDAKVVLDLVKSVKALKKKILDTSSLVIDDIQQGGTDDKKLLADGKKALKKLSEQDWEGTFAGFKADFEGYQKDVIAGTREGVGGDAEAVAKQAQERATGCKDSIGTLSKEVAAAVKFLEDTAGKIKKAKDASPELEGFGDLIKSTDPSTKAFMKDLGALATACANGEKLAKSAGTDAGKLRGIFPPMITAASGKASGKKAGDAFKKLAEEFKKVEKKLK